MSRAKKGIPLKDEHKSKIRNNSPKKIGVIAIDMNTGEQIGVFSSMREAERQTGVPHSAISTCCRGEWEHAGGYMWRYSKEVS